ncbi:FKBP-type peptidyl-prolyl cis-trans isomerase [Oxalobacteraceae bacterium]|nr:FKBP-type peptidyl-prolyl cis-trans isomerase [Oxalobacteraceae bacterium]
MKSTFPIIATLVCALGLSACGGGSDPAPTTPVVVQPAFSQTDLPGTGTEAKNSDLVVVHAGIWLYDASADGKKGAKVSSTYDRKQPAAFTLGTGAILPVMDQAIAGMKVGGKRNLIVPSTRAYGATEVPALADYIDAAGVKYTYSKIPANSALVIELELVSVTKAIEPVPVPPPTALVSLDLTTGTGTEAVAGKALTVNYTLWLYNGTVSDFKGSRVQSTLDAGGQPFPFTLGAGGVIPGWDQGVVGMKVGGKRRLTVPPGLGYGNQVKPGIPAGSTLIFEIELLTVK